MGCGRRCSEPLRWSERRHWWSLRRATEIGLRSLDLIAEDHAAQIRHPLTDVGFASSVERFAARHRLHDRTSVLLGVFSSVLPSSILERTSKAAFDAAFFGARVATLAGVVVEELADLENVAPAALREEWSRASPDAHSYLLLQAGHVPARVRQEPELRDSCPAAGRILGFVQLVKRSRGRSAWQRENRGQG